MAEVAHNDQSYAFSAKPRPVEPRQNYRTADSGLNIMADRRVVRGNTYAALVLPRDDPAEVAKQREAQRRRLMRANATTKRPGTPEPVLGRKHGDVQTDAYLEELTERVVEFEAETQTDFLLDRPQSPLFLPAKVGVDCGTQVLGGELFDFDREVEPVLEVLVGKTLEHGIMEVLEEEELASIRRRQALFEQTRHAELLDVQRMEAAEKRREEEKARRLAQEKARNDEQFAVFKKAHSRATARSYLSGLGRKCLDLLESEGLFSDEVQVAVEADFMPWLVNTVVAGLDAARGRQQLVEGSVGKVMDKMAKPHQAALAKEAKRRALIEEAERKIRAELAEELRLKEQMRQRLETEAAALVAFDEYVEPSTEPAAYLCTGVLDGEGYKSAQLTRPDGEAFEMEVADEDVANKISELLAEAGAGEVARELWATHAEGKVVSVELKDKEAAA
jgi:hypothetical protein